VSIKDTVRPGMAKGLVTSLLRAQTPCKANLASLAISQS